MFGTTWGWVHDDNYYSILGELLRAFLQFMTLVSSHLYFQGFPKCCHWLKCIMQNVHSSPLSQSEQTSAVSDIWSVLTSAHLHKVVFIIIVIDRCHIRTTNKNKQIGTRCACLLVSLPAYSACFALLSPLTCLLKTRDLILLRQKKPKLREKRNYFIVYWNVPWPWQTHRKNIASTTWVSWVFHYK